MIFLNVLAWKLVMYFIIFVCLIGVLVFLKKSLYKPVNSFLGKSNWMCLKFTVIAYITKVVYAYWKREVLKEGASIIVQKQVFFFFWQHFAPKTLKWFFAFLFPSVAEMHLILYTWRKECDKRECVNRNLKQILKKIQWGEKNVLQTNSGFLFLFFFLY